MLLLYPLNAFFSLVYISVYVSFSFYVYVHRRSFTSFWTYISAYVCLTSLSPLMYPVVHFSFSLFSSTRLSSAFKFGRRIRYRLARHSLADFSTVNEIRYTFLAPTILQLELSLFFFFLLLALSFPERLLSPLFRRGFSSKVVAPLTSASASLGSRTVGL